jgi:hypothetical protein
MPAALVLVVLVSTTETHSPASSALQHAAEEVLGSTAQVILEPYASPPGDAELTEKARAADLVAELVWQDTQHRRVVVHCYVTKLGRFVNRELSFDEQDALGERGRLVGFALASMAPEPETAAPDADPKPTPTHTSQPTGQNAKRASPRTSEPSPPPQPSVAAVDATLLGAIGLGGPAGGLGAGIAGRWFFQRGLSLRLGAGVRHGDVQVAQAASELFFGGLGLGFQFSNPESSSPFTFGGRTDLLLISHALRHKSSDDSIPEHQSRVMGGADLLLEGTWYFWKHAGLLLNGGGELAFGHTDVIVQGKEVADIPALRLVSELGIRADF